MKKTTLPIIEPPRQFSIIRPVIGKENLIGSMPRIKKPVMPTPENPLIISASELRDFLRCRVKWNWRHQVRIEPKNKSINLKIGGLIHRILEDWYKLEERTVKAMTKIATAHVFATDPDQIGIADLELVKAMCIGYAAWAKPLDRKLKMEDVQSEQRFDLPLDPKGLIRVHGYIDVSFKQASLRKTRAMFEHKSAAQFRNTSLELNLQSSVYLWAMRELYPKQRSYVAHRNTLRKQMPTARVSSPLFMREPVEREEEEIEQWKRDTARAALDMIDAAIYPSPGDDCSWSCDYQMPCLLRGRSSDLTFVLTQDYETKNRR